MIWDNTSAGKTISTLLLPASQIYGMFTHLHRQAYEAQIFHKYKVPVPVISIGNLTLGGTGKTPITIDLAHRLIDNGFKVAILSRGYKRISAEPVVIVSNGEKLFADAKEAGDEPYMMALELPSAVVISGRKRIATAQTAVNLYNCDIILLDDGFQHLPLSRNEDIVLLNYNCDLTKEKIFPAGRLREHVRTLAKATQVVITKVDQDIDEQKLNKFKSLISKYAPQANITSCRFVADKFINSADHKYDLDYLKNKKVLAFCGLANPNSFYNQLASLGANPVKTLSFADHHWYDEKDIDTIKTEFEKSKSDILITTEKDFVRIDKKVSESIPLLFLKISTQWLGAVPKLPQLNLKEHNKVAAQ